MGPLLKANIRKYNKLYYIGDTIEEEKVSLNINLDYDLNVGLWKAFYITLEKITIINNSKVIESIEIKDLKEIEISLKKAGQE